MNWRCEMFRTAIKIGNRPPYRATRPSRWLSTAHKLAVDVATVPPSKDHQQTAAKPFSEVPGPKRFPIIGSTWIYLPGGPLYGKDKKYIFNYFLKEYGEICCEKYWYGFFVHLFHPDDFETVFHTEVRYPYRGIFQMTRYYNNKHNEGFQGLFSSEGEQWYCLRKNFQKVLMMPKMMVPYIGYQTSVTDDFISLIRELRTSDFEVPNFYIYLSRFTLESVGMLCFNTRMGALNRNLTKDSNCFKFTEAVHTMIDLLGDEGTTFPWYRLFKTKKWSDFVASQQMITSLLLTDINSATVYFTLWVTQQEVNDAVKRMKESTKANHDYLIPYLLEKTSLSEKEIVTAISEIFSGGVDSTKTFISFLLYSLCKHPEVQQKLRIEILEKVPKGVITETTLDKLTYLKGVIKESARMYPTIPGTGRLLTKDIVCSGYTIPKGTYVLLHQAISGLKEEFIDDAHEFKPERWIRPLTTHLVHPFLSTPFGIPPRNCIGQRFALQEVSIFLIKIIQNFQLEYPDADFPTKLKFIFMPPEEQRFRFIDIG